MKKPLLAALGLAGACVACCTVPLALTLVGGLSAAGLAGGLGAWWAGHWGAWAAVATVLILAASARVWWVRRANARRADQEAPACPSGAAGACACTAQSGGLC